MSSGKAKRERRAKKDGERRNLFDLYAANWALYYSDRYPEHAGKLFMCPICLRAFNRDALNHPPSVNLAHVYPQACGGRLKTLTCTPCNSEIGSKYDAQLERNQKMMRVLYADSSEKLTGQIKLDSGGVGDTMTAEVFRDASGVHIEHVYAAGHPDVGKKFHAEMFVGKEFQITIPGPNLRKVEVSMLHSAYLCAFRFFGYEYVGGADTEWIREILMNDEAPKESPFRTVGFSTEAMSVPMFSVVFTMISGSSCLAVVLPSARPETKVTLAFLPGFGEDGAKQFPEVVKKIDAGHNRVEYQSISDNPDPRLRLPEWRLSGTQLWHQFPSFIEELRKSPDWSKPSAD